MCSLALDPTSPMVSPGSVKRFFGSGSEPVAKKLAFPRELSLKALIPRAVRISNLMIGLSGVTFEGKIVSRYEMYTNFKERSRNKKFCPFNVDMIDETGMETVTVTCKNREEADQFSPKLQENDWVKLHHFHLIHKDPFFHYGDALVTIELKEGSVVERIDAKEVEPDFEPEAAALKTPLREFNRLPENRVMHVVAAVWNKVEYPCTVSYWIVNGAETEDTTEVKVFGTNHSIIEAID